MTNFDFLEKDKQFSSFSSVAITSEKVFSIDYAMCTINCRRAMEFAIKWIYSVDNLEKPYDDNLISLMTTRDFKRLVDRDLLDRLHFIRKIGNKSAHKNIKITEEMALLCLENLHIFMDFVACCYSRNYKSKEFDKSLLKNNHSNEKVNIPEVELDLEKLIKENQILKAELSKRRAENMPLYVPKPLDFSKFETRKIYIEVMLTDSAWTLGKDWESEVPVKGSSSSSENGSVDYILYDDNKVPLALVEAKQTCLDLVKGREQAKIHADRIEKEYGRRPVIFLTNGFETRIIDGYYPERKVASIYSKRDLEKLFELKNSRGKLVNVAIDKEIASRYYQKAAIKAVCHQFESKGRRALLVMATGSGKTRTVIELCNVLLENTYIKNILFLADRPSLLTQAKRSFETLSPELALSNLLEKQPNYTADVVFSTFQTMMHSVDEVKDERGRIFTPGHFDLIVCDEAHRSIYAKYKDIFTYFDGLFIGLTSTPKDEIHESTYEAFHQEKGNPTYAYELSQAVKDGYLVDFVRMETKLNFLTEGLVYDELSEEEKEEFENTFIDEPEEAGEESSGLLNEWIFKEQNIQQVLSVLMENAIKLENDRKIGKTIIFAKNHQHAEKILEVFNGKYPDLKNYAEVIDSQNHLAQALIDDFSDKDKLPQIAISAGLLDTGIDVPEVVNLVFFKKVRSKAKFWQMIGRGTRLSEALLDGSDKEKFYIFDFCGNFDFFRMNKGKEAKENQSLEQYVFNLKVKLIYKLQDVLFENDELRDFREQLVKEVCKEISGLNRENFQVKQHLKYVEHYSLLEVFDNLSLEDTQVIDSEISSLIRPDENQRIKAHFDALLYGIELSSLSDVENEQAKASLKKIVKELALNESIPEIKSKSELIKKILEIDYLEKAGIIDFEDIRLELRDLSEFMDIKKLKRDRDFVDDFLLINKS